MLLPSASLCHSVGTDVLGRVVPSGGLLCGLDYLATVQLALPTRVSVPSIFA